MTSEYAMLQHMCVPDPRLLEKDTNEEMLDRHAEFGMRRSPKGFKGSVVRSAPELHDLLTFGGVTIADLSDRYVVSFPPIGKMETLQRMNRLDRREPICPSIRPRRGLFRETAL